MKFNYSYKAFLITSLLVGNLYLLLYSVKLTKQDTTTEEEYDVEFALDELFPEEELATLNTENIKIETHQLHNEAEDFIEEIESSRNENTEDLDDKLSEMDTAMEDALNPIEIPKNKPLKENNQADEVTVEEALENTIKNSTNSYNLVNRKAIYFPNPVYTCDAFGKVVIQIEVSASGDVISTKLNPKSSTTTNVCLIESALNYAKKARFTSDENKPLQLGSITYVFPGQE